MLSSMQLAEAVAVIAFLLPYNAYASPMILDSRESHALQYSDRWNSKIEDLVTWQDRMIAAGKMYRPNTTSVERRATLSTSWSLSNIACGFIVGEESEYDSNRDYLCNTMINTNTATFTELYLITQSEICQDSQTCTAITSVGLGSAGWYTASLFGSICGDIFDELYNNCNGVSGGSASLAVSGSSGSTSGSVENQFYEEDSGATCPANPLATESCTVRNA